MSVHSENIEIEANAQSKDWHELGQRIAECVGTDSIADVARRAGFNPETTRRYLKTGNVPARFIQAICHSYGVDPRWLVFGGSKTGPSRICRVVDLSVSELLLELACRIEERDAGATHREASNGIAATRAEQREPRGVIRRDDARQEEVAATDRSSRNTIRFRHPA